MKPPTEYGTCPACGLLRVPLTPGGRTKAHHTPGARGGKCKGGRPDDNTRSTR